MELEGGKLGLCSDLLRKLLGHEASGLRAVAGLRALYRDSRNPEKGALFGRGLRVPSKGVRVPLWEPLKGP